MFSQNYSLEEFEKYLQLGRFRIEEIIKFVRYKEEQKFSKIKKDILETYYRKILVKHVYNIKMSRDVYNNSKFLSDETQLTESKLTELVEKHKNKKYDQKLFKSKLRQLKVYNGLLQINSIKKFTFDKSKYKKNIVDLFNNVISIIIFHRNLYIFINNIYKFFSVSSLRTAKEIKHNVSDFSSYLNIDTFMKKHSLIGKNLVLDSLSIVCKSKEDFNIYINKLIEKMNNMDLSSILTSQWDLLDLRLKKIKLFTPFEIECIKLIIAIDYNRKLLTHSNKYIKSYNKNKTLFKSQLEKIKVEYKKISKFNKNILSINSKFTGTDMDKLINFNNYLNYIH